MCPRVRWKPRNLGSLEGRSQVLRYPGLSYHRTPEVEIRGTEAPIVYQSARSMQMPIDRDVGYLPRYMR